MKYASTYRVFSNKKHIATFSYTRGGEFWFLTIENHITGIWETRTYKTERAMNAQITVMTKRFLRIYGE